MTTKYTLGVLVALGLGAATIGAVSTADAGDGAHHASAILVDPSGEPIGVARFTEDATGRLHVNVKVDGLTPGRHGIHIHQVGSCTPNFAAAGAHHNPGGAAHGHHAGDLPNLVVNDAGQGRLNAPTEAASLSAGPATVFDADGSTIIIHAAEDDFVTQPTGNSGARVACGVLVPSTGG